MSTTRCESYSFPWIFKGCQERTGPDRGVELYPPSTPSSGQSDFRGLSGQGEKKTLPGALASVSKFICVAAKDPHPGSRILTGTRMWIFSGNANELEDAGKGPGKSFQVHLRSRS